MARLQRLATGLNSKAVPLSFRGISEGRPLKRWRTVESDGAAGGPLLAGITFDCGCSTRLLGGHSARAGRMVTCARRSGRGNGHSGATGSVLRAPRPQGAAGKERGAHAGRFRRYAAPATTRAPAASIATEDGSGVVSTVAPAKAVTPKAGQHETSQLNCRGDTVASKQVALNETQVVVSR
jgi:hypothetical protein